MPIIGDNSTETVALASVGGYQYTALNLTALAAKGSTEYTLATLVFDRSGSVASFQQGMEAALKETIEALQASPRADNLLVRLVVFDSSHVEVHGYELLSGIALDRYTNCLRPGGMTDLFGATYDAVGAMLAEARRLAADDYMVNGIVVVCTDGQDNIDAATPGQIRNLIQQALQGEELESIRTILIGVNENYGGGGFSQYLQVAKTGMNFDQYVGLGDASAKTLRKLADFVSKSVSSQSQSLGSGGPSQALTI